MYTLSNNLPLIADLKSANYSMSFYSADSEKKFNQNLKTQPYDWKWRTIDINYTFNSLGHRTVELNDLTKDFILTLGCSFTEGVGLSVTDTWPYKVSKAADIDYYNCAKGGSGMDIQYYNSIMWKANNLPIPKLVIVQWPQKQRKSFASNTDNGIEFNLINDHDNNTPDGKWWKRYISDTGEMHINNIAWYAGLNSIWESLGVPVLNTTYERIEELEFLGYNMLHIDTDIDDPVHNDRARDLDHPGAQFHTLVTTEILNDKNFIL